MTFNKRATMKIVIPLAVLMSTGPVQAIEFHSYVNDEGKTVFSNVPKNCVSQSVLTCLQYHPVFSTGNRISKSTNFDGKSIRNKPAPRTGNPGNDINSKFRFQERSNQTRSNRQFDALNRIVEMNKIMDEYFPGNGSLSDVNKVRQRQQSIWEVLQVIKKAANPEESLSIDHAIDIFRSNIID